MYGEGKIEETSVVPEAGQAETDDLLTLDEVAAFLKLPKSWIYERTRRKLIPHVKLGKYLRFSRAALSKWVQNTDGGGRAAASAKPDHSEPVRPSRRGRGRPLRSLPPSRRPCWESSLGVDGAPRPAEY
jgi:excisionase family DNA binding protein